MVIKKERRNRGATSSSSRPGNKHQKLPDSNTWPATGEQIHNVFIAWQETVNHIASGCEVLAKTEYILRHNKAAMYLHWGNCKDHDVEVTDKWYEPEAVMRNNFNNSITIMWDMPVYTDRTYNSKQTTRHR